MSFLLDTDVISEVSKPQPSPNVVAWLEQAGDTFLSVMTLGELRKGIERKRRHDPNHAAMLHLWLEGTAAEFDDRIVPVDQAVADAWGHLVARGPLPVVDSLIAATALVRNWTVATRNIRDFERCGVTVVNPFEYAGGPV